jgi:hypothetical protein
MAEYSKEDYAAIQYLTNVARKVYPNREVGLARACQRVLGLLSDSRTLANDLKGALDSAEEENRELREKIYAADDMMELVRLLRRVVHG